MITQPEGGFPVVIEHDLGDAVEVVDTIATMAYLGVPAAFANYFIAITAIEFTHRDITNESEYVKADDQVVVGRNLVGDISGAATSVNDNRSVKELFGVDAIVARTTIKTKLAVHGGANSLVRIYGFAIPKTK